MARLLASCRARIICIGLADEIVLPLECDRRVCIGVADCEGRVRETPTYFPRGNTLALPRMPQQQAGRAADQCRVRLLAHSKR